MKKDLSHWNRALAQNAYKAYEELAHEIICTGTIFCNDLWFTEEHEYSRVDLINVRQSDLYASFGNYCRHAQAEEVYNLQSFLFDCPVSQEKFSFCLKAWQTHPNDILRYSLIYILCTMPKVSNELELKLFYAAQKDERLKPAAASRISKINLSESYLEILASLENYRAFDYFAAEQIFSASFPKDEKFFNQSLLFLERFCNCKTLAGRSLCQKWLIKSFNDFFDRASPQQLIFTDTSIMVDFSRKNLVDAPIMHRILFSVLHFQLFKNGAQILALFEELFRLSDPGQLPVLDSLICRYTKPCHHIHEQEKLMDGIFNLLIEKFSEPQTAQWAGQQLEKFLAHYTCKSKNFADFLCQTSENNAQARKICARFCQQYAGIVENNLWKELLTRWPQEMMFDLDHLQAEASIPQLEMLKQELLLEQEKEEKYLNQDVISRCEEWLHKLQSPK